MNILVKPISLEELDNIKAISSSVMQSDFQYYSEEIRQKILTEDLDFQMRLSLPTTFTFFGAFTGDKLIGFLTGLTPIGGIINIHWIMVLKEFQGQGVGRQILNDHIDWAKKQGAHGIHLFSPEENLAFYQKFGFETVGLIKRSYYNHDDYFMNKIL